MTEHKERLEAIGLDAKVIELMQKKKSNVEKLVRILDAAGVQSCDKGQGQMFYQLSTKYPTSIETKLDLIASYIKDGKITKTNQLEGAIGFLKKTIAEKGVEAEIDSAEFEKESGVGIVVTEDDIVNCVNTLFEKNKTEIEEKKHDFNFNTIVYEARELMKWADFQIVMAKINAKKLELIGEAPKVDGRQKKGKAANKEEKKKSKEEDKKDDQEDTAGKKLSDLMPRDMQDAVNTPDQLKGHLAYTGGKIHTRFPPEPNGYLHIGHAKAMRFNFTIAKENEGNTYLRFDDTNPSKENQEFIDHIKGNVEWLGWKPFKVTASSDYFQELYELAVKLIKKGKAFVCHQTPEDIKIFRQQKKDSPYRERSIEENLKLFQWMKEGRFEEGECSLRMKMNMQHDNPCMRDTIAYRIQYKPHPHSGDKWCIYPTYDYTHCIVDSLENITHSLCTLEFEIRRESYFWLLKELDLYKPIVWEYSRLNISNTVLSKRKIETLVTKNIICGWDDPNILTLEGLKRRGYTPSILNDFCHHIGVARKGNENLTDIKLLEFFARKELDRDAPRTFGVSDPVLLEIVNFDEVSPEHKSVEAPLFPADKTKGTQTYELQKYVYIDQDDFSEQHKDGFFGLSPEQLVCLKYSCVVEHVETVKKADGSIDHVKVKAHKSYDKKLKGYIHWVSKGRSIDVELRLFNRLFTIVDIKKAEDKWLDYVNPESRIVKSNAKMWDLHKDCPVYTRFQFERSAYFVIEKDSRKDEFGGKLVLNRIVDLRESKEKKVNTGK